FGIDLMIPALGFLGDAEGALVPGVRRFGAAGVVVGVLVEERVRVVVVVRLALLVCGCIVRSRVSCGTFFFVVDIEYFFVCHFV
ncbi:hypothetical protein AAHH80_33355, partial [Burkholderia pseudomallei]